MISVSPGQESLITISEHLEAAHIILLLISADFVASDQLYDVRLQTALARHRSGDARVIPVILRPLDWFATDFADIEPLPHGGKPITTWTNRDEAWSEVARGIRAVCADLSVRAREVRAPNKGPGDRAGDEPDTRETARVARADDDDQLRRMRDMVVRWRNQYAIKVDDLRAASGLARAWMKTPPKWGEDVRSVVALGAAAARDLQRLPICELESAMSYGLSIHMTVFWGQAISQVLSHAPLESVPETYGFEMLARVLEAALTLTSFKIGTLPRGYLGNPDRHVSGDLRLRGPLVVTRVDDDPRLHLVAVRPKFAIIESFAARTRALHFLCAQCNDEGSLDLLAEDGDRIYRWGSSQTPISEIDSPDLLLCARFLSSTPGASVIVVDSGGAVTLSAIHGGERRLATLRPPDGDSWEKATIWIDPLDSERWHVIACTREGLLASSRCGSDPSVLSDKDIWRNPAFDSLHYGLDFWHSDICLMLGMFDNLSCLVVWRRTDNGSAFCFLDPVTLGPIRRPLVVHDLIEEAAIAAERWLFAAPYGYARNCIAVWDLDSNDGEPVGRWHEGRGEVYHPIVIEKDGQSFETIQVARSTGYELFRFRWPSGVVEAVERFGRLRVWPVDNTVV